MIYGKYRRRPSWSAEEDAAVAATIGQKNTTASDQALADRINRTLSAVRSRRSELTRPIDQKRRATMSPDQGAEYIPTPAQIAEAAAQIRRGWSEDARVRRIMDDRIAAEVQPPPYCVPEVSAMVFGLDR